MQSLPRAPTNHIMSTLRLTFLYPHLFRTARLGKPAAQAAARGSRRRPRRATPTLPCLHASPFASATTARQTPALKRHGKAVEPAPLHGEPDAPAAGDAKARPEQGGGGGKAENEAVRTEGKVAKDTGKAAEPTNAQPAQAEEAKAQQAPGSDSPPAAATDDSPPSTKSGPMDTILHMGPPGGYEEAAPGPGRRTVPPPHMAASPYVHHFDSYSLVKQLEAGGWTAVQAITAMKAIRGILAANLDVAQDGLVSKSDVENETYLFRAACSELSAEVRNNRRVADGQMRQQRTTLQHEVDILAQGMSQEVLTLNDNVRGMFNDRRMAVREEQKAAESAVSGNPPTPPPWERFGEERTN